VLSKGLVIYMSYTKGRLINLKRNEYLFLRVIKQCILLQISLACHSCLPGIERLRDAKSYWSPLLEKKHTMQYIKNRFARKY
jgi:hypothetical protein